MPPAARKPRGRRRRLVRSGVGGLGLCGILFVALVELAPPPSYHPSTQPQRTEGDEERVDPVRAGFGRASLNPEAGGYPALPLAGYGARKGRLALGRRDDLDTKAIALTVGPRTAVLVGMDALIVPPVLAARVRDRLRKRRDLDPATVVFTATHTHAGFGGWGQGWLAEQFAGPPVEGVVDWWAGQVVRAVEQALDDRAPAAFAHTAFPAPDRVRNRLRGADGRVQGTFDLAVFRQQTGRTAVLGAFAAPPTLLSAECMDLSGGYPGPVRRRGGRQPGAPGRRLRIRGRGTDGGGLGPTQPGRVA